MEPDEQNVGAANGNLGIFHYKREENIQAKRFYKEALRIYTKVLGPEHPETVKVNEYILRVSSI